MSKPSLSLRRLRDALMLGVGTLGIVWELALDPEPSLEKMLVCVCLMAGVIPLGWGDKAHDERRNSDPPPEAK